MNTTINTLTTPSQMASQDLSYKSNPTAPRPPLPGEAPANSADNGNQANLAPAKQANHNAKYLQTLADEANKSLSGITSLRINIDQDSSKVIIKVIDRNTNEVIRQIPSEDMMTLLKRMKDLQGLLFDAKA